MSRLSLGIAAVAAAGLVAVEARGAIATEYFNGYGTTQVTLIGLNGGTGWTGAWEGNDYPAYIPLAQNPAFNLTYSAAGYSNDGNLDSSSDGASMIGGAGGNAGHVATRSLRTGGTDTGWTGTIWASCLMTLGSNPSSHALLWLDRPDGANSFVAIRAGQAVLRYNGTNVTGPAGEYGINETYLVLAKMVLNASGTSDSLEMWINPDLSNGEAGLGAPKLSGANNADAFGSAFSGIGVSFEVYGKIDSIRISNGATAFEDVTVVPEPGVSVMALGVGALALARRRRHA